MPKIWPPSRDLRIALAWKKAADLLFDGDDRLAALSIAEAIKTRRLIPGVVCFNPPKFNDPNMNDTRDLWPWSANPPEVGLVEMIENIKEELRTTPRHFPFTLWPRRGRPVRGPQDFHWYADFLLLDALAATAEGAEVCGVAYSIFDVVQWNAEFPGAAFPAPAKASKAETRAADQSKQPKEPVRRTRRMQGIVRKLAPLAFADFEGGPPDTMSNPVVCSAIKSTFKKNAEKMHLKPRDEPSDSTILRYFGRKE